MSAINDPAYRIETERLVLRCYEPSDAEAVCAVLEKNRDHLSPWMPWAKDEPKPIAKKVDQLRDFRGRFDLNKDFIYGAFDKDEETILGGSGLHPRCGEGGLELGYWVDAEHLSKGLATELAAALVRAAFELHAIDRVEIHCNPKNIASRRVPQKLGFTEEGLLRQRPAGMMGTFEDLVVHSLLRAEYETSPARSARIEAFNAVGAKLI